MLFARFTLVALGTTLVLPSMAWAEDLVTAGGFTFDIRDTVGGEIADGTRDAYDRAYSLTVNGTTYNVGGAASTTTLGGRNVVMSSTTIGGLVVQRQIYVPAAGGDYARFLDVVTNPGTGDASVTVSIGGDLGSDASTVLWGSSSGDTSFTSSDTWFGTDDAEDGGLSDPSLAHVLQGVSSRVTASTTSLTGDDFSWSFSTTVPGGERIALLTFAIQKDTRAAAMAEAANLSTLPDSALFGLDDHLDDIVNFDTAVPGAPSVRFEGPYVVDEGDGADVTVSVDDAEGDAVSWSWDTDDDGSFGELEGESSYSVPAGTTDGDGTIRVGVSATDGTHTTERYRTILVMNVPPAIVSTPDLLTSVAASYRYQIEVEDPAADLDPLEYALLSGPDGMVVSEDGLLTWTPQPMDVTAPGEPLRVAVRVDDGDGGVDMQEWDLTVSPNRAPTAPTPIYPIGGIGLLDRAPRLVVGNADDEDLDSLTYFFQIDPSESFDSEHLLESDAVAETAGYSYWRVPEPLPPGRYFWRAWSFDGTVESERREATFFVVPDVDAPPDAGVPADGSAGSVDASVPPPSSDDGGCSAAGTPSASDSPAWLLLLLVGWRLRRWSLG